mmetsp:Transcript_36859/g.84986  ORF Transcript_36859/g.84986 Transcript_36859/m.84986 type:complete len:176 (-) Transcript_36859:1214-1741(-)
MAHMRISAHSEGCCGDSTQVSWDHCTMQVRGQGPSLCEATERMAMLSSKDALHEDLGSAIEAQRLDLHVPMQEVQARCPELECHTWTCVQGYQAFGPSEKDQVRSGYNSASVPRQLRPAGFGSPLDECKANPGSREDGFGADSLEEAKVGGIDSSGKSTLLECPSKLLQEDSGDC